MRRADRRPTCAAVLLVASLVPACHDDGTMKPPTAPPTPKEARELPQASLLLYPIADAEGLLGRSVRTSSDGAWTIADARAPGCRVEVNREPTEVQQKRRVDITSVSTFDVGYAQLVGVHAKFGRVNQAEMDIRTTAILRANLAGPCGDTVIDTVYVGTGSRSLLASASRKAGVNANIGPLTPSVATDAKAEVVDSTAWQSPQAYGFGARNLTTTTPLDVTAHAPSIVKSGDSVELSFETSAPAYLVVYYLDASGQADVLWPSNEEQSPTAAPGQPAVLPSSAERARGIALRAQLPPGKTTATRETLVVYAFAEKADFDVLKPQAASSNADGAQYAAALSTKLSRIPANRWARTVLAYTIQP